MSAGAMPPPEGNAGWTPEAQARFLQAVAQGATVQSACLLVGLSKAGAYALRRRADGAAFARGWSAAELLARETMADLAWSRAVDGYTEIIEWSEDRRVRTRHCQDNRLLMATLSRLDNRAESLGSHAASDEIRAIAADFPAFLQRLRAGDVDGAAATGRHRLSAARAQAVEVERARLINNLLMYGLEQREDRVHAGRPTADLDSLFDRIVAALGEPPFDWEAASAEAAEARAADTILSSAELDSVLGGAPVKAAPEDRDDPAPRAGWDEPPGMRPFCPPGASDTPPAPQVRCL